MNTLHDELITAAISQFEAQARRAEANLRVYLNRASGVSEHPDVVGEVMTLTKQVAEARECVAVLDELHGD